ncbi:GlsB/YeaQ/YmgE family stress response membrane protein [Geminicoccaceae bacterium 1502E]|nr:GlsB/YeaQ/YmgE family stress response membrane protein [Geminicoccaceae bacterium 1502E]
MALLKLILFLAIGALAGWIAGNLMRGGGFGLWRNMALGVVGSIAGGVVVTILGFTPWGLLGNLITATLGAVLVLWLADLLKKRA